MYKRKEIFEVAARLHAGGDQVTVRSVRDRLRGPKGSFSTVGPLVAEWKTSVNWRSRPSSPEIPVGVQEALNSFAAALWGAARDEAWACLSNERAAVETERDSLVEVRADIGLAADALERRVQELRREMEALKVAHRDEVAELRQRVFEAERRGVSPHSEETGRKRGLEVKAARAFWDGVMLEVAAVLRRHGAPLDAERILLKLPAATRAEAARYDRFTAGVLAEKMGARADRGRMFARTGSGGFALLGASEV